jgi:hypothetical protein
MIGARLMASFDDPDPTASLRTAALALVQLPLDERERAFFRLVEEVRASDPPPPRTAAEFAFAHRRDHEIWRIAASIGVTLPSPRPR